MSKYSLKFKGPKSKSRAQQNFRDDVNINTIMAKARKTGLMPRRVGETFLDLSAGYSYQDILDRVMSIDDKFAQLPAKIRTRFDNDPGQMLAFLSDQSNHGEAIELGFFDRPEPEPEPEPKDKSKEPAEPAQPTKGRQEPAKPDAQ